MKYAISALDVKTRKRGPKCIACGNADTFWVRDGGESRLIRMREAPEGELEVLSCGRCRSRNSIVLTYVD